MCDFTWSTTSTEISEKYDDLTFEKLAATINEFEKKHPCPFEQFANEHGYSLEDGDLLIVPEGSSDCFPGGVLPRGMKESKLIARDKMYLMRNPLPKPLLKVEE